MIVQRADTTIEVLAAGGHGGSFDPINTEPMTTGRKYAQRTKETTDQRVLDGRTRAVLNTVLNERRGRSVDAYLIAIRGISR